MWSLVAGVLGILSLLAADPGSADEQLVQKWSLSKAVEVLNSSPWARHETFTRLISGVGSGVSGEKEIFDTFYVRFLSAKPIREAIARIQQIQYGYDKLSAEERRRFDTLIEPGLQLDVERWIVVAVSFRSNDPNEESAARRFFQKETAETLKNKAFLSTEQFPQIPLATYFLPREEGVGAKFVFPRAIAGVPVVSKAARKIVFELLEVPGATPRLRASFAVKDMWINGELII
ncbi:MAG: hypothetical protein LAP85_15880 [Acidobacteriia bacterium]|nr:hypothetical protein [Terriglobia bacterium]